MTLTLEIGINLYHLLREVFFLGVPVWLLREWWVVASVRGKR